MLFTITNQPSDPHHLLPIYLLPLPHLPKAHCQPAAGVNLCDNGDVATEDDGAGDGGLQQEEELTHIESISHGLFHEVALQRVVVVSKSRKKIQTL